jgi:NAD(P)-dependent dehydrogenase (short-subunit alcohol dehydrogenase family)
MNSLHHKIAIVTGAASGIGKAIALLFAKEGSKVIAADRNAERLDILRKEALEEGLVIDTLLTDMSSEDDIEHMVNTAVEKHGTLDILVNNAGIMDSFEPVAELSNTVWEKVMRINVEGVFKSMRAAMRIYLPKNEGIIINIASVGGLQGARAGAAYTASKFAVVGLTRNTGYLYAKTGIRCNAIAPGAVQTNIGETIDYSKMTPLVNDRIMSGMVLNPRTGDSLEIAKAALFLASDASSFVNGQVLVVDGGWTAY